ncbi:MAG: class I SAM-dependent methyltransferase [Blautia sp.]|nr:class I SAM-dependent methyltransferase [Blautia sp.]MDY5032167.1 class I SAM-dependent methyltransferase [Blautia sp.]
MQLSERLRELAGMVTPGNRLVDVGCDHGYLPIWLVRNKIIPSAIAMDVRRGPLSKAQENIRQYALSDYIQTRLSWGLRELSVGEGDTLTIAGMGGPLMESLLEECPLVRESFAEMILQPQSDIGHFRHFIRSLGWEIIQEKIVLEDGKFYPMMKVRKAEKENMPVYSREEEWFGRLLLEERNPILKQLLKKELKTRENILDQLKAPGSDAAVKRMEEIREEQQIIRSALEHYESI